jgi:hypothetical protein
LVLPAARRLVDGPDHGRRPRKDLGCDAQSLGDSLHDTRLLSTSRNLMASKEPNRKRVANPKEPVVIQAKDPSRQPGELRRIGGSASDDWNNRIANDTRPGP